MHNTDGTYSNVSEGEFEAQLQIGSKLFPEYPIRSHNECYYQLKKTLGVQASLHNFNNNPAEHRDYKLIWATDCEKVLDAGFTGINKSRRPHEHPLQIPKQWHQRSKLFS